MSIFFVASVISVALVVCAAHHRIDGLLAFDKRGAVSARMVMFALLHSCYVRTVRYAQEQSVRYEVRYVHVHEVRAKTVPTVRATVRVPEGTVRT